MITVFEQFVIPGIEWDMDSQEVTKVISSSGDDLEEEMRLVEHLVFGGRKS